MIFVKSLLTGLVAAVVAVILLLLGGMAAVAIIPHPEGTNITINPMAVVKSSRALWVVAIAVFVVSFFWDCRRARRRLPK